MALFVSSTIMYPMSSIFNKAIITADFSESEAILFFRISEINNAIEIRVNNPEISTSKILNAIEFDGVLKFTNLSNSAFWGNISEMLMIWSPFDSSSVKLYCISESKL